MSVLYGLRIRYTLEADQKIKECSEMNTLFNYTLAGSCQSKKTSSCLN